MKRNTGIEPVTTRLSIEKGFAVSILNLVDVSGIEPLTFTVSTWCSTSELNIQIGTA